MIDAGEQTGLAGDSAVPESPATPSNVVILKPCRCPNRQHHDGDLVFLNPKVTISMGIAAMAVIQRGGGTGAMYGGFADLYLRYGIAGWTFTDKDGDPIQITMDNIELWIPFDNGGLEVAEAADALYQESLMRPLRKRYPKLFETTPTEASTSLSGDSGSAPQMPSEPSSRNGTGGKRSGVRAR